MHNVVCAPKQRVFSFQRFISCRVSASRLALTSAATPVRTAASTAARRAPDPFSEEAASSSPKPFSAIPGPTPSPLIRNLLDFRRNSKRINQFLGECYKEYGEIFKLEAPGESILRNSYSPIPEPEFGTLRYTPSYYLE